MPIVVAFISQKGGVGKSTLARALAAVAAHARLKVMVADLDPRQHTLMHWEKARRENKIAPSLIVEACDDVETALAAAAKCDLLIVDAPGHVDQGTLAIARALLISSCSRQAPVSMICDRPCWCSMNW